MKKLIMKKVTMKEVNLIFECIVFFIVFLIVAAMAGFYFFDLRLNTTTSYPQGIYKLFKDQEYKKGDLIMVCPPTSVASFALNRKYLKHGFCNSGSIPLLKRLVGIAGDYYEVKKDGVYINKEGPIKNTSPQLKDIQNRELIKAQDGLIPDHNIFIISDYNPKSFDSRYFGYIPNEFVHGVAIPLFIFWR